MMHHVQNFLSLAMSTPTYPLEVNGTSEASKTIMEDGKETYNTVDIFSQQSELPSKIGSLHSSDILFTLDNVQEQLETYLANWINKAALLEPVHDLYSSVLYSQHMYLHIAFLSLAQALETYHRRTIGGKYQSNEEYRAGLYVKFVEVIPPELDEDFKQQPQNGKFEIRQSVLTTKEIKRHHR